MEEDGLSFQGQLAESEFSKLQWVTSPRWVRFFPWLILIAWPVTMLTGGWHMLIADPVSQLPGLLFALALAAFMFIAPRRAIRKAWATNASVQAPLSGSVSPEGLAFQSVFADGQFPWSALYGYRLAPGLLLIYTSNRQVLWLLPRFFAGEAEWRAAVAMAASHLAKR